MVAGVVVNLLALATWAWGGPLPSGDPAQRPILALAAFLQFAAVGLLLAATIVGVRNLARKSRQRVWAVLSSLAFPLAVLFWMPAIFIVWRTIG